MKKFLPAVALMGASAIALAGCAGTGGGSERSVCHFPHTGSHLRQMTG